MTVSDILLEVDWLEARLDLSQALQVLTQASKQQPSLAALPARRAEVLKNLGLT